MPDATKLARLAAGSLLVDAATAHRKIASAVQVHAAQVAAEAVRHEDRRNGAILALLVLAAKSMSTEIAIAILAARQVARESARRRLNAEFRSAGIALESHQWTTGHRSSEDEAHAASAADSLAGQWRGLAMASVLIARRKERLQSSAIAGSSKLMGPRIVRTAQTEIAQAYSDEHRLVPTEIAAFDRKFRDGDLANQIEDGLVREWCAMLEACPVCSAHDGDQVRIGESFSGGDEPGSMHPRCQCFDVIVPADASARKAA